MARLDQPIPEEFLAAIKVQVNRGTDDVALDKAIGMVLHRGGEILQLDEFSISFEAAVELFVDPPTLSVCRNGTLVLNLKTKSVQISSPQGFSFTGLFSNDFQCITGSVSLGQFELLDVYGQFDNVPVTFRSEASEVVKR